MPHESLRQHERHDANREALELAQTHNELERTLERSVERASEQAAERGKDTEMVRAEALDVAQSRNEHDAITLAPTSAEKGRTGPISREARGEAFSHTMHTIQAQMSAPGRTFSKFIHAKPIEKASEAAGATIARPNALLAGAASALLLSSAVYIIARYFGYPLSGFETIAAFIAGWLFGLLFDYFKIMLTGKKL